MNDASNPMPVPIAPDGSSPSPLNPGRAKPSGALHPGDVRTLDESPEAPEEHPGEAGQAGPEERSPDDAGSTYGGLRIDPDEPVKQQHS
jgi:hypothetical protein